MADPFEFVVERDNLRRTVRMDTDRLTIGRGRDSDLQIEDPLASRVHCRLERLGSELFVVDLDSANGTWVDGVRVQRRPLGPANTLRIGSTSVRLSGSTADRLRAAEATQTQQQSREREMLQTLLAVLRALEQEDKLERAAALLIDAAVTLARAERGFLFLVEKGHTTLAIGRNFAREPVPAPERKVSRTLLGRAMESEQPLLLQDAASDGQFAGVASISDLGLRSLLAIPLRAQGEVLGLLLVDHRLTSGAFRHEDKELLVGLASIASQYLSALRDHREMAALRRRAATLQRQLGQRVAAEQEETRRAHARPGGRFAGIIGASPAMQRLYAAMERVLDSDVSVLVSGESGTGKELVAQALHFGGPRAEKPFVTENCGALPDTLLESELFGHVKGAFTGATRDRAGRFEEADGGTLFLDEVSEMSPAMQARLLRALQEGEVRRLGSDEVCKVDVRVIAATNTDLMELGKEGRFREDLYYRLKVIQLDLPPLRQRQGDIELLAEHFLALEATEEGRTRRGLGGEALAAVQRYPWPGNVRELRNEMRRLTLLGEGPVGVEELSAEVRRAPAAAGVDPGEERPLPERVAALEVGAIRAAMGSHHGNRSKAARQLGISRFALLRKIEKYGLDPGTEG